MSTSHDRFATLFPPLLAIDSSSNSLNEKLDAGVDISVDDILLPPLEKAVDAAIYSALQKWNELERVNVESALSYAERIKKYRAVVSWILYQSGDADEDEDDDEQEQEQEQEVVAGVEEHGQDEMADGDEKRRDREIARRRRKAADRSARKEKKREKSKRRKQLQQLQKVFQSLPAVEQLREERLPSERLRVFTSTYSAKARALQQKRSMGDTKTDLCFEFARPAPPMFPRKTGGDDNENDDDDDEGSSGAGGGERNEQEQVRNQRTNNLLISRGIDPSAGADVNAAGGKPVEKEELVIWLDVLHPSKEPAKTQSFLVRESTRLSDVIDLVMCAFDQRLGDHDKHSKLVYFDSQFYTDRRHPDNIDYADKIREWIKVSPSTRGVKYGAHLAVKKSGASLTMESTCFRDLALKVDLPGVYIHQGECEHLLRIRDARLPHEFDAKNENDVFPMRLPNPHFRALRNCFICQQYSGKYICYGDRMGISDPMFFCERCYRAAHFDSRGELIYRDFQSFPYIQD